MVLTTLRNWQEGRGKSSSIGADWDVLYHSHLERKYNETQKAAFTEQQQGGNFG